MCKASRGLRSAPPKPCGGASRNPRLACPGFTASNIRNVALAADGNAQGESPRDEGAMMSSEEVARHLLEAVRQRRRDLILTSQGKLTVWLNRLLPGLADKLVLKHFRKEEPDFEL